MTIIIEHQREQHPVGQGLFHSGSISDGTGKTYRYVYDCGAMLAGNTGEIEARTLASRLRESAEKLDAVYISHFHEDHMNAISILLDRNSGVNTDKIFMPLLSAEERILRVAGMIDSRSALAQEYAIFGAVGLEEFLGLAPGTVVEVAPSQREPNENDQQDMNYDDRSAEVFPSDFTVDDDTFQIRTVSDTRPTGGSARRDGSNVTDDHGQILSAEGKPFWEFRTFVTKAVRDRIDLFLNALKNDPDIKSVLAQDQSIAEWLEVTNNRALLFSDYKLTKALSKAYKTVRADLNLTSLSLYSGPFPGVSVVSGTRNGELHTSKTGPNFPLDASWLGTGDAKLMSPGQVKELVNHFGDVRLNKVVTLVVPHHGSNRNFSSLVAGKMLGAHAVYSYGTNNRFGHPGNKSLDAARGASMAVIHVTEDPASRFIESFLLSVPI